jgi:acetyltransferase-like isoleucine patch superfamily enzyme
VQFVNVYIFDIDGDIAAIAVTDGLGNFETDSGLPPGSWYVATQAPGQPGVGNGLIDEVWTTEGGIPCLGDCEPVGLGSSVNTPEPLFVGISLDASAGSIDGTVISESTLAPLGQVALDLYDAEGTLIKQTQTNGSGEYSIDGVLEDNYHLVARPLAGNYGAVLFDGIYCDGGCDVTTGMQVLLGQTADFALPDDNCPNLDNPDQADWDGDGRGDACARQNVSGKATVASDATIGFGVTIAQGASVASGAEIGNETQIDRDSSIGTDCEIGTEVDIDRNVTIGADCVIGNRVQINRDSILGERVSIGNDTVIGQQANIGNDALIGSNVTLGRKITVPENACIVDGANIRKNKDIEDFSCN